MLSTIGGLVIWLSCCSALMILILLSLLFKQCKRNSSTNYKVPVHSFIKYIAPLTILCIVFYTFTGFGDLNHAVISYINNNQSLGINYYYDADIPDIFYFISTILLYILLFSRLFFTFKNTKYEISSKFVVFIIILLLITIILMSIYCIFLVPQQGIANDFLPFAVILMIFDIIINLSLAGLFASKLHQVTKYETELQDNDSFDDIEECNNNNNNNFHINSVKRNIINHRQNRFLQLITKHTILSLIIITVNQLFWILELLQILIITQNQLTYCITYGTRTCQCVIISITLYFNFHLNGDLYYILCNCLHVRCYKCCLNIANKD